MKALMVMYDSLRRDLLSVYGGLPRSSRVGYRLSSKEHGAR